MAGMAGGMVCSAPLLSMVAERSGRSCRVRLRIARPLRCWTSRETARTVNTMVRWASIRPWSARTWAAPASRQLTPDRSFKELVEVWLSVVREHSKDPSGGHAYAGGTCSLRSVVHHSAGRHSALTEVTSVRVPESEQKVIPRDPETVRGIPVLLMTSDDEIRCRVEDSASWTENDRENPRDVDSLSCA